MADWPCLNDNYSTIGSVDVPEKQLICSFHIDRVWEINARLLGYIHTPANTFSVHCRLIKYKELIQYCWDKLILRVYIFFNSKHTFGTTLPIFRQVFFTGSVRGTVWVTQCSRLVYDLLDRKAMKYWYRAHLPNVWPLGSETELLSHVSFKQNTEEQHAQCEFHGIHNSRVPLTALVDTAFDTV